MSNEAVYRTAPATPGLLKSVLHQNNNAWGDLLKIVSAVGFLEKPSFAESVSFHHEILV